MEKYKMKRILKIAVLVLSALVLFLLSGCKDVNNSTIIDENFLAFTLPNAVYAGTTPQDENTGWLTISFKTDNKVVCAFLDERTQKNNTTFIWDYIINTETGEGSVTSDTWAPGKFFLSADGKRLMFDNYGGNGGERTFKRLCASDESLDPVPFALEPMTEYLWDIVWTGPGLRDTDWVTILFKDPILNSSGKVTGYTVLSSFSVDYTDNRWNFSYNEITKKGSGYAGPFEINGDDLYFTNFFGHEAPFVFFRVR